MTEPPKPTTAQQRRLDYMYKEFGRNVIRLKTINRVTGHMRIEADSVAGPHVYVFSVTGELIQHYIRPQLFDPNDHTPPPRNAQDN